MKNILLTILTFVAATSLSYSQVVECNVSVSPTNATICPGDSVFISAIASITAGGQSFDFDTGTLPPGWTTSGTTVFSTPCGPGPNGSTYFWAASAGAATPLVSTASFDVGCGGSINFDMVFAVQGGTAPCEGPDLANEGVELQYSIDGGLTWITIVYYSPGGFELPNNPGTSGSVASGATPYTTWNTFNVPIPLAAQTPGTMFQWIQTNSSGTCCDNWGLENISIQAGPCASAVVDWNNGLNDTTGFWASPPSDTAYVAYVYDTLGVLQCISDSIFVNIAANDMTFNLPDSLFMYCPNDSIIAEVTNMANGAAPFSFLWSTGDTLNPTYLPTGPNQQDAILYTVDVTDGCNYVVTDSVYLIVNQLLSIDSVGQFPASSCAPDGTAFAVVSGITDVLNQPFYNWTGPGNPGPNNVDATVINNIPSGWYYFTVTDDVCEANDSVFVEMNNPPIADFSASVTSGCIPVNVVFNNNSQNATTFDWDFGNGNQVLGTGMGSQSESFLNSSTVTLTATDAAGCSDFTVLNISVTPCGCTDPNGLNYNPLATEDDGTCVYPDPIIIAPNVFTPNNDSDNDNFALDVTNYSDIELTITNRWGNVMYSSSGLNPAWNGDNKGGNEANEGTYFYTYKVTGIDPTITVEGHGFLQLVRD